jgi:cytochrome c-type biogenesis protein CcsB
VEIAIGLTTVLYLAASVGYVLFLVRQRERFERCAHRLLVGGLAVHSAVLLLAVWRTGTVPSGTLRETLIIVGWAVAVVFVGLQHRLRLKVLGLCAAPLAALATVVAVWLPTAPGELTAVLKSIWVPIHVVSILIGEAAFALAAGIGLMYLLQERAIKAKQRGFFFKRLPSLDQLDHAGYACIVVGFATFTLALATGFVYARAVWGRFWGWDPKEVWSGITWLIYAILLHQRLTVGWRGRRAALMALVGFAAVLFTFLGVNFLLKGHHGEFTRILVP